MNGQQQLKIDMRYAVQTLLLRIARSQWCRRCNCLVEMVTAREAASSLACATVRSIYHAAESGRIHHVTAGDGSLLICRNSLQPNEAVTEEFRCSDFPTCARGDRDVQPQYFRHVNQQRTEFEG